MHDLVQRRCGGQLTVDAPAPDVGASPRRGYRRIEWIETALQPIRGTLSPEQFGRLVAALAVVAGWGSMVVLRDVCGLPSDREEDVLRWMAGALVRAITAEVDATNG